MGSAVHDYTYTVQVKSRFDLFAKDDFNVEDSSMVVKSRAEKRERRTSGKAKSEASEKVNVKDVGSQKDRRGDAKKSEQKPVEAPKKDHPQRGKGGFSQGRMDRHSGSDKTGIKAVMKKDGYGTGNWGTIEDELEAQTEEVNVDQPAEEKEFVEQSAPQEPAEEQPKTYTLKEYKEMKKKANVTLATSKTRRPNDGKNVFSDMVVLHNSQPVETKVEVILEDPKQTEEEAKKPAFFEFGRGGSSNSGRPFPRGGQRGGRGGRGGTRNDQPRDRKPVEQQEQAPAEERSAAPEEAGGEKEVHQPTTDRRGRGRGVEGGRTFRGRGRGGRGGFSSDRGGRGRAGTTPAGDRPPFRGGERGVNRSAPRGAGGPRGGFSTGERGGRPEGGRGGFRRGGRGGGFEQPPEVGSSGCNHNQQKSAAPRMDSDTDFPALK